MRVKEERNHESKGGRLLSRRNKEWRKNEQGRERVGEGRSHLHHLSSETTMRGTGNQPVVAGVVYGDVWGRRGLGYAA